jgi:hypothetical protein
VRTRVSKVTYGSFGHIRYDPSDPDHISLSHNVYTAVSGIERINGYFDIILLKVSCVIPLFFSLKSMLFVIKIIGRIPKFRRQRNSEGLIPEYQVLQMIFDLLLFLFGVTVEILRLLGGKMLIPVSHFTIIICLATLINVLIFC